MKIVMYLGERVHWSNKIIQLFKSRDGKEYHFKGIKAWVGNCYRLETGDKMQRRPEVLETNWEMSEKEKLEYEAQKEIVKFHRLNQRKAMELKKPHKDIVQAIYLLKKFYHSMDSIDRKRFMQYLDNQLSKRKNK